MVLGTFLLFLSLHGTAHAVCDRPVLDAVAMGPSSIAPLRLYKNEADLTRGFEEFLAGGKRLNRRAYQDNEGRFMVDSYVGPAEEVPLEWIEAISRHIGEALAKGYADFVFYPDLGHVHVLESKDGSSPKFLLLYHAGELLEYRENADLNKPLSEDPWIQERFQTRNFVGGLDPATPLKIVKDFIKPNINVVSSISGYKSSITLAFSAHHTGCFKTTDRNGHPLNFDIAR